MTLHYTTLHYITIQSQYIGITIALTINIKINININVRRYITLYKNTLHTNTQMCKHKTYMKAVKHT